jgi:hypothetical protein
VFNTQILNSAVYQRVTGEAAPTRPITAATYASFGLPFFHMYEEPSGIHGDFGMVKSVAELDKKKEDAVEPKIQNMASPVTSTGLINMNGPLREFRTVGDLEKEYSGYHVARF